MGRFTVCALVCCVAICVVAGSPSKMAKMSKVNMRPMGGSMNVRVQLIESDGFYDSASKSGFAVDVLKAVEKVTPYKFQISASMLGYPKQTMDGMWTGSVIQALLDNSTDMVGPDLTRCSEGQDKADFLPMLLPYHLRILVAKDSMLGDDTQYVMRDTAALNTYLKNSKESNLMAIYQNIMASGSDGIVSSVADGVNRVMNGNGKVAFIIQSLNIQKAMAAGNGMVQILDGPDNDLGGPFATTFAVAKGSPLTAPLSVAFLKVIEQGVVKMCAMKYMMYETCSTYNM